jgi:hypothetical protein
MRGLYLHQSGGLRRRKASQNWFHQPEIGQTALQQNRISLWENVAPENRCGECHVANDQSPSFARNDDISLAYDQVNTFFSLAEPGQSRLVTKVGEGHNCWLTSSQACTDILTTWVSNWAGDAAGSSNVIELRCPALKDPGASKSFPQDSTAF